MILFILMLIALTTIVYAIKSICTGEAFKPIIKRKEKE
jgi:hypothetical protein